MIEILCLKIRELVEEATGLKVEKRSENNASNYANEMYAYITTLHFGISKFTSAKYLRYYGKTAGSRFNIDHSYRRSQDTIKYDETFKTTVQYICNILDNAIFSINANQVRIREELEEKLKGAI